MSYLLIIESHTPLTTSRLTGIDLALEAAQEEQQVKLWLTQDATQLLQLQDHPALEACCEHENIDVFVDEFTLDQRGIVARHEKVTAASIETLTDHFLDTSAKPIWH